MLLGLRDPASVQQHSTLANLLSSQAQINHLCRSGGCDSPAKLEVKKGHINIETPLPSYQNLGAKILVNLFWVPGLQTLVQ